MGTNGKQDPILNDEFSLASEPQLPNLFLLMHWIGYVGVVALVISWIPQSIETIRLGHCPVNTSFLILLFVGNASLAIYALSIGDTVFSVLNVLTIPGAAINIYFKLFPRKEQS